MNALTKRRICPKWRNRSGTHTAIYPVLAGIQNVFPFLKSRHTATFTV